MSVSNVISMLLLPTASDPLSITGSILNLVLFGAQLSLQATKFVEEITGARDGMQSVVRELEALCEVLSKLDQLLRASNEQGAKQGIPPHLLRNLASVLDSCGNVLTKFQVFLNEYTTKPEEGIFMSRWKAIKWGKKNKEYILSLKSQLSVYKDSFNILVVLANCMTGSEVEASTARIEHMNRDISGRISALSGNLNLASGSSAIEEDSMIHRFLEDVTVYADSLAGSVAGSMASGSPRASLYFNQRDRARLDDIPELDSPSTQWEEEPTSARNRAPPLISRAATRTRTPATLPVRTRQHPPSILSICPPNKEFLHIELPGPDLGSEISQSQIKLLRKFIPDAIYLINLELEDSRFDQSIFVNAALRALLAPVEPASPRSATIISPQRHSHYVKSQVESLLKNFLRLGFVTEETNLEEQHGLRSDRHKTEAVPLYYFTELAHSLLEHHICQNDLDATYQGCIKANDLLRGCTYLRRCLSIRVGHDITPLVYTAELEGAWDRSARRRLSDEPVAELEGTTIAESQSPGRSDTMEISTSEDTTNFYTQPYRGVVLQSNSLQVGTDLLLPRGCSELECSIPSYIAILQSMPHQSFQEISTGKLLGISLLIQVLISNVDEISMRYTLELSMGYCKLMAIEIYPPGYRSNSPILGADNNDIIRGPWKNYFALCLFRDGIQACNDILDDLPFRGIKDNPLDLLNELCRIGLVHQTLGINFWNDFDEGATVFNAYGSFAPGDLKEGIFQWTRLAYLVAQLPYDRL